MNIPGYKELKILYHQLGSDALSRITAELKHRIDSPSSLKWNYSINSAPIFVNMVSGLTAVLEKIWRRELEIEQRWMQLPGAARVHYLHSLLVNEIRSSNEIEGIYSTRKEVQEAIEAADSRGSACEIPRPYQEMAKTYMLLFGELRTKRVQFPTTLGELRELFDSLLGQEISSEDDLDGEFFRKGPVSIVDGIKEKHRGAEGEEAINAGVQAVLQSQQDTEHLLVNAFVGHFMLEHVHPFYDGNGRFGRFLLSLKLTEVLSAPTAISLSSAILQQKSAYYKAFKRAEEKQNSGELTFFVFDMAMILLSAMDELLESLVEKSSQLKQLESRMNDLSMEAGNQEAALNDKELAILFLLGQVHLFGPRSGLTQEELCKLLDRSAPTVRSVTIKLRDRGLIEEIKHRPLVFSLTREATDLFGISD